MKNCRFICAVFFVVMMPAAAFSETWAEAAFLCKANNNSILSARKQLEAGRWSYYRTLGSFLPQV
ncbi:MAG: hypothetical protein AABZ57_02120, partial [Candidatus Margulisiibacteriota bacterium]